MPFISIQLNSNRPAQIMAFFDSIESTVDAPQDIEVLLHIDEGDEEMERLTAREQGRRRFHLRILKTGMVTDFSTLWKPLNALFAMTHPDAYFVTILSDEMLFQTKGWDSILRKYKGRYPDDIFRLRASTFRYRNYTDFWECGFAPDSIAFYTRRWLALQGDWNPCAGPDSFQQCVAFYLYTSDPFSLTQYNRDVPVAELQFSGEGVSVGLKGRSFYKRLRLSNRAWFTLMSHGMQQQAKRRAMQLKAAIIAHGAGEHASVSESADKKCFYVIEDDQVIARLSYRLSWLRIMAVNLGRIPWLLYYQGGGKRGLRYSLYGMLMMMATYLPGGDFMMERSAEFGKRWLKSPKE